MKVAELVGTTLALWTARAIGYAQAFRWQDHSGKTVIYLRSTDAEPFMPHEDWRDCGPLLPGLLAAGFGIMQADVTKPFSAIGPFGKWDGADLLVTICRARVALHYGAEVPDGI